MHNLGWGFFETTGDIDAYLLYRTAIDHKNSEEETPDMPGNDEAIVGE